MYYHNNVSECNLYYCFIINIVSFFHHSLIFWIHHKRINYYWVYHVSSTVLHTSTSTLKFGSGISLAFFCYLQAFLVQIRVGFTVKSCVSKWHPICKKYCILESARTKSKRSLIEYFASFHKSVSNWHPILRVCV